MAATLSAEPVTPASAYRPLQFSVNRTDPSGTLIVEVFIADSADVIALGNGLEVGDVVVYYTGTIFGSVPLITGQTILMDADCGPYAGVQMVTNAFDDGTDFYAVIDAVDAGDFTPVSMTGSIRVWLNNYTLYCRVYVYTNPAGSPQIALLKATPDLLGNTAFNVDTVIPDYFSHRIEQFAQAIGGGTLAQDAHGVTALFYKVWIAEVYDVPGDTDPVDPFDGDHTVFSDDLEAVAEFRVAVNGIHPYAGDMLTWATAGLGGYVVGASDFVRRFLTDAPRVALGAYDGPKLAMGTSDRFRVHMLTDVDQDYQVDHTIRVFDMTSGSAVFIDAIPADLGSTTTAAVSFGIGPADLAPFITVPALYRVFISDDTEAGKSEPFEIAVETKCSEVARVVGCLNPMGGYDTYTFRGRERELEDTARATISKPYGTGTGFDFMERTYRVEPKTIYELHSKPIEVTVRKWIGKALQRSPNVVVIVNDMVCPAVLLTKSINTSSTGPLFKPVSIEYRLGVDNLAQRA